jgi:hypothetical protein
MTLFRNARDVIGHPWWAPLAVVLVIAELLVAQAFLIGEGTSNVLDAESTLVGAALALAGAGLLMVGLVVRSGTPAVGHSLIITGAALAAIWFWVVVMTPLAVAVIVGVAFTQMREASPADGRS